MKYLLKILLPLLFLFCSANLVNAQQEPQYKGLDILGIAKQDPNAIVNTLNLEGPMAIGLLEGTFGNTKANLLKVLRTGKVTAVRFHLFNGPCWRNKRCEKGEPNPKTDFTAIATRSKDIALYMDSEFPSVPYFISPVLEHDVTDQKTVNRWFELIKQVAPKAILVCNSFKGWCPNGILKEKHGNNPGTYDIVSNDGVSIFNADTTKYRTMGRVITFSWYEEMNLLFSGIKVFIPPTKRTCKSTSLLFRQAYRVLKAPTINNAVPASCKNVVDFTNKQLFKSNSESYCDSDTRGNKGLFILNKKYASKTMNILAPSGKVIACAKYYGLYEKSQHRYYIGSCKKEANPVWLNAAAGQERMYLQVDSNTCFRSNAIRRLGYFK